MNTPGLNLTIFSAEVEKMRIAQKRYFELMGKAKKSKNSDAFDEARKMLIMSKELESNVDQMVSVINSFKEDLSRPQNDPIITPRLATDQITADERFLVKLEDAVEKWKAELELIEKELIDQALIDTKAGERSNRYLALEKREKDLKYSINEANVRLGRVTERVANPVFANQVEEVVSNTKRHG